MKTITLFCMLFFYVFSQAQKDNAFLVKFGVNYVDSSGESNPFIGASSFKENAFSAPLKLGVEYRLSELVSFGLDGSLNKWKAPDAVIDRYNILEDQNYFALDAKINLYADEAFNWFVNADWLDVYLNGGLGYFKVTEGGMSGNLGAGANVWVSKNVGLNFEGAAKFVLKSNPARYESNHFLLSMGLVFKLSNSKRNKNEQSDLEEI